MLEQDTQKMKWRLVLRIATSPSERWLIKAAVWNPELSSKYRTNRAIGRPRKRWEDDINEFFKFVEEETENLTESSNPLVQKSGHVDDDVQISALDVFYEKDERDNRCIGKVLERYRGKDA